MTITLLDGRSLPDIDIEFRPDVYHFSAFGEDITDLLRRSDKQMLVDGFDVEKDNTRLYVEKYRREHGGALPPDIGSDSVWANFFRQIATDPLGAPVASILGSTTGATITTLAVVAIVLYAVTQLGAKR